MLINILECYFFYLFLKLFIILLFYFVELKDKNELKFFKLMIKCN